MAAIRLLARYPLLLLPGHLDKGRLHLLNPTEKGPPTMSIDVQLDERRGKIRVEAPELFSVTRWGDVRSFVERSLSLPAVARVVVAYGSGRATLDYEKSVTRGSTLLRQLADVLTREDQLAESPGYLSHVLRGKSLWPKQVIFLTRSLDFTSHAILRLWNVFYGH